MAKCPECGKNTIYITTSGLCADCNRRMREAEAAEASAQVAGEAVPMKRSEAAYRRQAAEVLGQDVSKLDTDEIHRLAVLAAVKSSQQIYSLLMIILVVIPLATLLISAIF